MVLKIRIAGWVIFAIGIVVFFVGGGSIWTSHVSKLGVVIALAGMITTSISNVHRVWRKSRRKPASKEEKDE